MHFLGDVISTSAHPLEPLTPSEISQAVAIVRQDSRYANSMRFVSVSLHEPPKAVVAAYQPGDTWDRAAFVILLDNADGLTHESVVSLTERAIASWVPRPGVQPNIMLDEFLECEAVVKAHPD